MQRRIDGFQGRRKLNILCLGMARIEQLARAVVPECLGDLVNEILRHVRTDDPLGADGHSVDVLGLSLVGAGFDDVVIVVRHGLQEGGTLLVGEHVEIDALRGSKLGDARDRRAPDDEEGIELAVREAVCALLRVELRSLDVILRNAVDLQQLENDDLGPGTGREDADALALQILDPVELRTLGLDKMHMLRKQVRDDAKFVVLFLELPFAIEGLINDVGRCKT